MMPDEERVIRWFHQAPLLLQVRIQDTNGRWREFQVADMKAVTASKTDEKTFIEYVSLTLFDGRKMDINYGNLVDTIDLGSRKWKAR